LKPVTPTKEGKVNTFKVGPVTYIPVSIIP